LSVHVEIKDIECVIDRQVFPFSFTMSVHINRHIEFELGVYKSGTIDSTDYCAIDPMTSFSCLPVLACRVGMKVISLCFEHGRFSSILIPIKKITLDRIVYEI
jgi:hypothetical protein